MKTALMALAALVPVQTFAEDPKPYVVYNGQHVPTVSSPPASSPSQGAVKSAPAFSQRPAGPSAIPASGVSNTRTFVGARASGRRGFTSGAAAGTGSGGSTGGTGSAGGTAATVATEQGGWATPGSKILTAGQPPTYTTADGGGTSSINGGGFVAIDQRSAHDVGRAPSIYWAPPDTPPSATPQQGASGNGATTNGRGVITNGPPAAPLTAKNESPATAANGTGFDPSF